MKLGLTIDQKNFFLDSGHLLLEGVFSLAELQALKQMLAERIGNEPVERFKKGRDLFRSGIEMRKAFLPRKVLEVVRELSTVRPLRMGLDQVIPEGAYQSGGTLSRLFSIQGLEMGICIALESGAEETIFPKNAGDVLFISSQRHLPLNKLKGEVVLIALALPNALYVRNLKDPHAHHLRALGYEFADKLNDREHPIICR